MHDMGLKIVVLENMYTKEELDSAGEKVDYFLEDLEIELRSEIESGIGPIQKMEFFNNNPRGIVKIKFSSAVHAEDCIKVMNGRFFDGREIKCGFWDGKTDYRIARESNEEVAKRIDEFGDWLET